MILNAGVFVVYNMLLKLPLMNEYSNIYVKVLLLFVDNGAYSQIYNKF